MNYRTGTALVIAAAALALPLAAPAESRRASAAAATAVEGPAVRAATFEVYKDKAGEYRWRLRTANGQVIATGGDGYKERRDCLAGIESVRRNAPGAKVEDAAAAAK